MGPPPKAALTVEFRLEPGDWCSHSRCCSKRQKSGARPSPYICRAPPRPSPAAAGAVLIGEGRGQRGRLASPPRPQPGLPWGLGAALPAPGPQRPAPPARGDPAVEAVGAAGTGQSAAAGLDQAGLGCRLPAESRSAGPGTSWCLFFSRSWEFTPCIQEIGKEETNTRLHWSFYGPVLEPAAML
ncbi:uncharacterized protein LOC125162628 isoform X2 [Prionailurus viverrinus]|uniref:uncharacterized protein LOC125162628 isoform X2 n=1 Tax=Prionailurus viverrinus TaxID=61388 RepID=UPI001FF5885F|nr:uncharacterized protein LOC125162628 isoform X2 [Prionailurus viverrinus]